MIQGESNTIQDEDELFSEVAMQVENDSEHAAYAESGLKTKQETRLHQIVSQVFRVRGLVPIKGLIEEMFHKVYQKTLNFFGLNDE